MENIPKILLVLFLAGAMASCRDKPRNEAIAKEDSGKKSVKKLDPETAEQDARFVMSEVSAHVTAVEWTMPELKDNENRAVRDLAFKLHREHKRLLEKWKEYAAKRNVLVADTSLAAVKNAVVKYTGIADDSVKTRFWVDKMLEQEKAILARLEDFMDEAGDPELKILVENEMPAIRDNRDQLMILKSKI